MVVGYSDELAGTPLAGEGMDGIVKKVLVSPAEGWEGWCMRLFEVGPAGHTPRHRHGWPHINVVLAGGGTLHLDGVDHALRAGAYAYVPAGALHQFSTAPGQSLSFVCIVPAEGDA
jgi:quercetin dioxygenase-like cupin family protein